tara:strand:+ start:3362 stop:4435 length:1074 start_codon:yes stop_codon:yes gene_type:complete
MKKLSKRDYKKITKFYKSKKHTRKNALKTISRKFCSCVEKVKAKKKGEAIGICTKSVINRKGFKRGKFSCKRKPSIQLYKGGKRRRKKKTRKKRGGTIGLWFDGSQLTPLTHFVVRAIGDVDNGPINNFLDSIRGEQSGDGFFLENDEDGYNENYDRAENFAVELGGMAVEDGYIGGWFLITYDITNENNFMGGIGGRGYFNYEHTHDIPAVQDFIAINNISHDNIFPSPQTELFAQVDTANAGNNSPRSIMEIDSGGGKRRKKKTRKKRGGIRLGFPRENLIFFNVDDNFRIFLDQWWNTIDENQREFIRNMNIEALEHLVNALRVIYQIEQIVNQQQQNQGGGRRKKKTCKRRRK